MSSNTEAQRRWKAAQRAQGRRRVEFWVTGRERRAIQDFLKKLRAGAYDERMATD